MGATPLWSPRGGGWLVVGDKWRGLGVGVGWLVWRIRIVKRGVGVVVAEVGE
jgi:hypothetical protein